MSRKIFYSINTLVLHCCFVNSANILGLFPHPGKSHHMVFEPFLKKLASRGHNVTVASFYPAKDPPPNYHNVSFEGIAELKLETYDLGNMENESFLFKIPRFGRMAKRLFEYNMFKTDALNICARLLNHKPLLDALEGKYDAVIIENFTSDCMFGLLHVYKINVPIIAMVSSIYMSWTFERVGCNDNTAYVPAITSPFGTKMSFLDRFENTIFNTIVREWYYYESQMKEQSLIEKKYGEIPDLRELAKNTSLMLANSYHTFTGVKPLIPGLIEVGGLHLNSERKPLPQFLGKFLNESSHGVILFSFGSHIKTKSIPKYKEEIFIKSLSKLKQRVIWKFEDSDDEGTLIGNVLKVKWLPQYDLLRHDKVIAFISHGGLLGLTEAVSVGKPIIVVPFFGDQPTNAAAVAEAGIGVTVSYDDISEDSFGAALQTVLSEEMRALARRVSGMWHDRPLAPLSAAVFWTEHVARWHAALHSRARDLPAYQLWLLDVYAFVLALLLVGVLVMFYIVVKIASLFRKVKKEKMH